MKMFIEDAMKFVTTFFPPIFHSAPHIYLSALPMSPSDSLIAKTYYHHFTGVVSFERGKQISWPTINSILQGHADSVTAVACSPDGKYIVSGSYDETCGCGQCCAWQLRVLVFVLKLLKLSN